MIHDTDHRFAGKSVKLNELAEDPLRGILIPGTVIEVENWYDRVDPTRPVSWMDNDAQTFTTMHYAQRVMALGAKGIGGLADDEVVYGHVNGLGHIVHTSELGEVVGSWH